eukprot:8723267-Pyramimonas_sp.AAC.1
MDGVCMGPVLRSLRAETKRLEGPRAGDRSRWCDGAGSANRGSCKCWNDPNPMRAHRAHAGGEEHEATRGVMSMR